MKRVCFNEEIMKKLKSTYIMKLKKKKKKKKKPNKTKNNPKKTDPVGYKKSSFFQPCLVDVCISERGLILLHLIAIHDLLLMFQVHSGV